MGKASSSGSTDELLSMRWDAPHRDEMRASTARLAKLAAPARALGDPLGSALERGDEAQERHERPEQPHGQVESAGCEDDSRASGNFENRAGVAALGGGEPGGFGSGARA